MSSMPTRRARPPRTLPCSNSATRTPACASVTAAAQPAQPPPITATEGAVLFIDASSESSASLCRLQRDPQLAQRRERDALIQHAIAVAFDLIEQRSVDRRHDEARTLCRARFRRQKGERAFVPFASPFHLERHQI